MLFSFANAQNTECHVSGVVKDSINNILKGATVIINKQFKSVTDETGHFYFDNIGDSIFTIEVTMIGYEKYTNKIRIEKGKHTIQLNDILLLSASKMLNEIIVIGKSTPVKFFGDTLDFNLKNLYLNDHAVLEDLLKLLPGVIVEPNGSMSFLGKPLSKMKVDGLEVPVNNVHAMMNFLQAHSISKVRVIDDYGIESTITGRKLGNTSQILSIETNQEKQMHDQLQLSIAGGSNGRYEMSVLSTINLLGRWNVAANANNTELDVGNNYFKNFSLTHSINNDLLSSRFILSYGGIDQKVNSVNNINTATLDGNLIEDNNTSLSNENKEYQANGNLDYNISKSDKIWIEYRAGLQNKRTVENIQSNQTGLQRLNKNTLNITNIKIPNMGSNLVYTHAFKGIQSNLLISFNITNTGTSSSLNNFNNFHYTISNTQIVDSSIHQLSNKKQHAISTNFRTSFIKKFCKEASLEIRYRHISSYTKNNINAYDIMQYQSPIDSLSTQYHFNTNTNEIGTDIKGKLFSKIEYLLGANVNLIDMETENSDMKKYSLKDVKILPYFRLQFQSSNSFVGILTYNTYAETPSSEQIQPIKNLSNPQFPIIGNPNLKFGASHNFSLDLKYSKKFFLIFNAFLTIVKNKIVPNTILIYDSSNIINQEIHFLNSNGTYNTFGSFILIKNFSQNKYVLSSNSSYSFNNNVIFISGGRNNSRNLSLMQFIKGSMFLKPLEFSLGCGYTFNKSVYTIDDGNSAIYQKLNFRLASRINLSKSFFVNIECLKFFNYGLSSNVNTNQLIFNITAERAFLNNLLSCKLQGYNLFNQGSSLNQTISGNSIIQTKSDAAGRFVLLSAVLNIEKFKFKELFKRNGIQH